MDFHVGILRCFYYLDNHRHFVLKFLQFAKISVLFATWTLFLLRLLCLFWFLCPFGAFCFLCRRPRDGGSCCYLFDWLNRYWLLWRWLFLSRDDLPCSRKSLWDNILLSKSKVRIDSAPPLLSKVIIAPISAIQIVVPLEPLRKLEVVLVLSLRKFFHLSLSSHLPQHTSWFLSSWRRPAESWGSGWTHNHS